MIFKNHLETIGNTPIIQLPIRDKPGIDVYAKLDFCNPTGSIKDRAASYILKKLLEEKKIDRDTVLIESSSGNFGISLAAYCQYYGLKFLAVIDPCILSLNEFLIRSFGAEIRKVDIPDCNGGYLLNRIEKVKELLGTIKNAYWVNQYGNPYNAEAYYATLGDEICDDMKNIDYIFIGVSSGGTITGVSNKIKERFPQVRVVAVDIIGSVIFGYPPAKRWIPGIGSSMVPEILKSARIDDVVRMDEKSTIKACHELTRKYHLMVGGSSGSVFAAINRYFSNKKINKKIDVVAIFPDRGERYADTIYNKKWYQEFNLPAKNAGR